MTEIKGFSMKNISLPKTEDGKVFRKGILYKGFVRAGFFKEYGEFAPPLVFISPAFQEEWTQMVVDYQQEYTGIEAKNAEEQVIRRFIELIDAEKKYRVLHNKGFSIMATYVELKEWHSDGETKLKPSGRLVHFKTTEMDEIEELENTELKDMKYDRYLYKSMDDFIIS